MGNTTNIFEQQPDHDTVGGRLCKAREAAGLTAKELAWRLGVRMTTVRAWESDRSAPSASRLATLAGLLNVSLSWLLHGIGAAPRDAEADPHRALVELAARVDRLGRLHERTGRMIGALRLEISRIGSA